jgi:hypothetical protein
MTIVNDYADYQANVLNSMVRFFRQLEARLFDSRASVFATHRSHDEHATGLS